MFKTFGMPDINHENMMPVPNKLITSKNTRTRMITTPDILASAESNSNIINTSKCALQYLTPGEVIKIVGADTGGGDLECVILEYLSNTQIKIDRPTVLTVNNATINTVNYSYTT